MGIEWDTFKEVQQELPGEICMRLAKQKQLLLFILQCSDVERMYVKLVHASKHITYL